MTTHLLSLVEFKSRAEPIIRSLFNYRRARCQPFSREDWSPAAVGQRFTDLDEDISRALIEVVSQVDGDSAYVVAIEEMDGDMTDMCAEVSKDRLPKLNFERSGLIRLFDYAAFDESRSWAIISYVDDFTVIGGDAAFMNAFASRIEGGLDALKRRFIEYCDDWYPSVEFRKKVLAGVGWEDAWQPKE